MDDVLTTEEAAKLLKFKPATIRRMAREKKIPGNSAGRDWRFSRSALMRWVEGDQADGEPEIIDVSGAV